MHPGVKIWRVYKVITTSSILSGIGYCFLQKKVVVSEWVFAPQHGTWKSSICQGKSSEPNLHYCCPCWFSGVYLPRLAHREFSVAIGWSLHLRTLGPLSRAIFKRYVDHFVFQPITFLVEMLVFQGKKDNTSQNDPQCETFGEYHLWCNESWSFHRGTSATIGSETAMVSWIPWIPNRRSCAKEKTWRRP